MSVPKKNATGFQPKNKTATDEPSSVDEDDLPEFEAGEEEEE